MSIRQPLGAFGLLVALATAHAVAQAPIGGTAASSNTCAAVFGAALASAVLPDGWTHAASAEGPDWQLVDDTTHGVAWALRLADHGTRRYESAITTPRFLVPAGGFVIGFAQRRDWSWANTVGVLEIAVGDRDFIDVGAAGARFLEGAYDGRSFASNPLGERPAWTAAPRSYTPVRVLLPAALAGLAVRLRLRAGSAGTGDPAPGWFVTGFACETPNGGP